MKRSDMRKKIAEELIPDGEIWYDDKPEDWTYQEAMAEEIICFVEKYGMSPPDWDNTVYGYNEGYIEAPDWEPEDDTR